MDEYHEEKEKHGEIVDDAEIINAKSVKNVFDYMRQNNEDELIFEIKDPDKKRYRLVVTLEERGGSK